MKVFYSVFTIEEDSLNYQGIAYGATNASKYYKSKGIPLEKENVCQMVTNPPKKTHPKAIVVRHEVEDHELLTAQLEKRLKLEGTKQAEAILIQRRDKKNGKQK